MDSQEPRVYVPDTTDWAYIAWILVVSIMRGSDIGRLQDTNVLVLERGDPNAFDSFRRNIWEREPLFHLDWFDARGRECRSILRLDVPNQRVEFAGDLPWQSGFSTRPEPILLIENQPVAMENGTYDINPTTNGWEIRIEFRHTFEVTN